MFREQIEKGTLLFDGAIGTLLHSKGAPADACFDALNLTHPEMVLEVHQGYLEAGADVIETNTFSANRFKLTEHGLADKVAKINQAGVALVKQAVSSVGRDDVFIAGAIGPLGIRLAPIGRISVESAVDAFREQAQALIDGGVDVVVLETFSDLKEIGAAVEAIRAVSTDIPIIAQATFTRDDRTLLGATPSQVAQQLADLDVQVIGVNCAAGPAQIKRIVGRMREVAPDMRFSAIPNAGYPENMGGRVMYAATPDYFADFAVTMREWGIAIVGGCCGTTPDHIQAMRAALDDPTRTAANISISRTPAEAEAGEPSELFAPSALAQKLARGDFIIAVEMSPPRGVAAERELRAAEMLREVGADVIDVLDSPMARMRMSPWALCHLLQTRVGVETVLHFPTRGRNLLRVQGDLLAAHAMGVRNLFIVMGDPTKIGDYPDALDSYDIVPSGLVGLVKNSLNEGIDSAGNEIGQPTNFLVSCALSPTAADLDRQIRVLRKKLANGADYLLTQPIYDVDAYRHFLDVYESKHGPLEIPVLVGILPLYNVRNATFLHNEVPGINIPDSIMERMKTADDPKREGVVIAQELAQELSTVAQGLYLMPQFGRYDLVADVIEKVRQPILQ